MHDTQEKHSARDIPYNIAHGVPLAEFVKQLKTEKGRVLPVGSDSYHVLAALYSRMEIDDYFHRPTDYDGKPIPNVRTRISSDLESKYRVTGIQRKRAKRGKHTEYYISARDIARALDTKQPSLYGGVA